MMQMTRLKLKSIYSTIFNCFIAGRYSHWGEKPQRYVDIFAELEPPKPVKKMKKKRAQRATIDYMIFAFAEQGNFKYHQKYYDHVYIPDSAVSFQNISFEDFLDFISPQTERTRNKKSRTG